MIPPILWGTTYFTTTAFLLADHPLLTGTIRALPAGLVLLTIGRRLPHGSWWWKSAVLGALNITVFFICIFIAASRLPGGVAAVIGGVQPLIVAVLASRILSERVNSVILGAGVGGVIGVGLIVLQAEAGLDALGIGVALIGAVSMGLGTVLAKRWGKKEPPLVTTSWQLLLGGIFLAIVTAVFEPLPDAPLTPTNLVAYAYLTLIGTALAYLLWFRGIKLLPTRIPAFLGLVNPVVAIALGTSAAGETLLWPQITGIALVLISVTVVILNSTSTRREKTLEVTSG